MPTRRDWPTAAACLPDGRSLEALREAAGGCRGCPLHDTDEVGACTP